MTLLHGGFCEAELICRNEHAVAHGTLGKDHVAKVFFMSGIFRFLPIGVSVFLVLAWLPAASAQSSDPDWLDALRMQLEMEEACEVNYFINMREGRLGTSKTYEARVQCVDGRMFDASRTEPEEEFFIRPCGIAVC